MPHDRRVYSKEINPKVKAVGLVGAFLSALGAALSAADVISWEVVAGALVTAGLATFAGYQKSA